MLYLTFWFRVLSLKESNRKEVRAECVRGYSKGALKVQRIHCRDGGKEESIKGLSACVEDPADAGTMVPVCTVVWLTQTTGAVPGLEGGEPIRWIQGKGLHKTGPPLTCVSRTIITATAATILCCVGWVPGAL